MSDKKKSTRDQAFGDRAEGGDQAPTDDEDQRPRTTPARFLYPNPGPHGRLGTTG